MNSELSLVVLLARKKYDGKVLSVQIRRRRCSGLDEHRMLRTELKTRFMEYNVACRDLTE